MPAVSAGELADATRGRDPSKSAHELRAATRVAVAWGSKELAGSMYPAGEPVYLRSRLCMAASLAILSEADGDIEAAARQYADVALAWAAYGCPLEEAYALLGAERCLAQLGRSGAARRRRHRGLSQARALGRSLGAVAIVEEADRLLAGDPRSSVRQAVG